MMDPATRQDLLYSIPWVLLATFAVCLVIVVGLGIVYVHAQPIKLELPEQLLERAYSDALVELRAERLVMRALLWVLVVWFATFPLAKLAAVVEQVARTLRRPRS